MGPRAVEAAIGTRVAGKYELLRVLGRGGAGAVFEARHLRTDARCALKLLHPAAGPEGERRLLAEARALARLSHPNIVRLIDFDAWEGGVYLAAELIEGSTLRALLDDALVLPPDEALALLLPVLRALGHAHSRGVVHRDIKPENIVLREGAQRAPVAVLVDFDLSRGPDAAAAPIARRTLAGTPRYMSPEQACGREDLDARSDLWSFAAVLYECLAGSPPYDDGDARALLESIVATDPPHLRGAAVGVGDELADAVMSALVRAPEARCPSAEALERALVAASAAPPTTPVSEPLPPSVSRRRAGPVVLGVALAAAIAAVAVAGAMGTTTAPRATSVAPARNVAEGSRDATIAASPMERHDASAPSAASQGPARDAGGPWYRRARPRPRAVPRGANAAPIVDDL